MVTKLLYFLLAYLSVMASGPVMALLLLYVFKADPGMLIAHHPVGLSIVFALYGTFVAFMFFALQDRFIVFRPPAGTTPLKQAELLDRLEKAFSTPVDGRLFFDFAKKENRAIITWAADAGFFQGTNMGGRGMKRVLVLTCDEAGYDVYFIMREKDWRWNATLASFDFSMNYSLGIYAEFTKEWYPSIGYSADGLKVDIQKLAFSSEELMQPVQSAVLSSGWTLRGGMVPGLYHRLLFCLPLTALFFCMGLFLAWTAGAGGKHRPPPATTVHVAAPAMSPDQYAESLRQSLPSMNLQSLRRQLEGILSAPAANFRPEFRAAFTIYGHAYLETPGSDPAFAERLQAFAQEKNLPLAKGQ
ncbi:MAG: hypothetical protein C4576_33845 [Desulfobacteraceae bacterium]|nr:MAG: hypothetical protein C4576_33845 [Desulfobacteraceae bacterium]